MQRGAACEIARWQPTRLKLGVAHPSLYHSRLHDEGRVGEPCAVAPGCPARGRENRWLQFHPSRPLQREVPRVRVYLGIMADAVPLISTIERLLGAQFDDCSWPMESARGSLADRCWREAVLCETNSLKELVGAALLPLVLTALQKLIGERRFACVPALSSTRNYGVLLFEKEGADAFNRQQREVLIRYAKRIGEILENDLMGQGQSLFDQLPNDRQDSLWL